jgi:hypothetical protein
MRSSIIVVILLLFIISITNSQEKKDTLGWHKSGFAGLNFSQAGFTNWAQGGENSIAATSLFNYTANYKERKSFWDNTIDLAYGLLKTESFDKIRKNEDKIDLTSKYGHHAFGKVYYSGLLNFKSQFAPGYNYPDDSTVVSRFMAPGYLTAAVGLDWRPNDWFSFFFSPATGRFIFVTDDRLSSIGAYGVDTNKNLKVEFGSSVVAQLNKEVVKNVTILSKLTLFNNYTDKRSENRKNTDVDWQTGIAMKVNDFLGAAVFTHLIYDDDINVSLFEEINGVKTQVGTGKRLQFKEIIGVGFSYKFK